jgi:hypothetical protein
MAATGAATATTDRVCGAALTTCEYKSNIEHMAAEHCYYKYHIYGVARHFTVNDMEQHTSISPLPYSPIQTEHLRVSQLAQMLYHEACAV